MVKNITVNGKLNEGLRLVYRICWSIQKYDDTFYGRTFLQTLYIFKIPVNYIHVLMCFYKNNNNFQ